MTIDASPNALLDDGSLTATLDWQRAFLDPWILSQRNYLQSLAAWQKAVQAFNQDLFDRWVCRFGGGVPLDG
jgi:hypothetical protein